MDRKQRQVIQKDLDKKIVFIAGPRQTGKTWLAQEIAKSFLSPVYLNYDRLEDRRIIDTESWLDSTDLLILDELHKKPGWKSYLKGLFDTRKPGLRMIVTGSARLDFIRSGGDSMAGRFFTHRLYPLSMGELEGSPHAGQLERLMMRSGFPEPFLAEDDVTALRWRNQYIDGLIREDVVNFEQIASFRAIQLVLELLREQTGSPVSYTSIARDVAVAPNTVKKYIQILEALFIVFRVTPFSRNIARALLKEPKLYFFDTGLVKGNEGARYENLVALALLKQVSADEDIRGIRGGLHYIKTKDSREVDFCIAADGVPKFLVEAKLAENTPSPHLLHFCGKYNLPGIQAVKNLKREFVQGPVEVRQALPWLRTLY